MNAYYELRRPSRWTRARVVLGRAALALSFAVLALAGIGPRTGLYQTRTVLTASMSPSMPAGSVVLIQRADPSTLRVGDVITYRIPVQDGRIVTHRVVAVSGPADAPTVRTKGDALEEADPWSTRLGKGSVWRVRATVPHLGHALQAMRHPLARHTAVLVLPALLALVTLARIWAPGRAARRRPAAAPAAPPHTIVVSRDYVLLPALAASPSNGARHE